MVLRKNLVPLFFLDTSDLFPFEEDFFFLFPPPLTREWSFLFFTAINVNNERKIRIVRADEGVASARMRGLAWREADFAGSATSLNARASVRRTER